MYYNKVEIAISHDLQASQLDTYLKIDDYMTGPAASHA